MLTRPLASAHWLPPVARKASSLGLPGILFSLVKKDPHHQQNLFFVPGGRGGELFTTDQFVALFPAVALEDVRILARTRGFNLWVTFSVGQLPSETTELCT
jgi:hypothetical protein